MIVWSTFHRTLLNIFWMVAKMIQRCVSFQLFWRGIVRNIDCSDVIQIFAPFFCPVMLQLACMRYFIFLEAVKNRLLFLLIILINSTFVPRIPWKVMQKSAMSCLNFCLMQGSISFTLTLYFVNSFLNFMQLAVAFFISRPSHSECCLLVGLLSKIFPCLQVFEFV